MCIGKYVYIHIHIHTYTHIRASYVRKYFIQKGRETNKYVYIYICRQTDRQTNRETGEFGCQKRHILDIDISHI